MASQTFPLLTFGWIYRLVGSIYLVTVDKVGKERNSQHSYVHFHASKLSRFQITAVHRVIQEEISTF